MSDEQTPSPGVYVDYAVLSPFGPLKNTGGPFASKKEADNFVKELAQHHKQLLVKADIRKQG